MSGVWVPHPVPLDLDHVLECSDCLGKLRTLVQELMRPETPHRVRVEAQFSEEPPPYKETP